MSSLRAPCRVVILALLVVCSAAVLLAFASWAASPPLEVRAVVPTGEVRGQVSYSGAHTTTESIIVGMTRIGVDEPPAYHAFLQGAGPYTITGVATGGYQVFAYMDLGADMLPPQPDEPFAWYDANADGQPDVITVAEGSALTGIDIHLTDPGQTGLLTGVVSYSGAVTGTHLVWVGAFVESEGAPVFVTVLGGPGPYTLTVAAGAYRIMAGMDADDSGGPPDPSVDPLGEYAHNPVVASGGAVISGVDIMLLDPGQPPPGAGSIGGEIAYTGRISPAHQIIIVAGRQGSQGNDYYTVIAAPGPYVLRSVSPGTYWVFAFMDTGDDMGPPGPNEPSGWYDPNSDSVADLVNVGEDPEVMGINITLHDPRLRVYFPVVMVRR